MHIFEATVEDNNCEAEITITVQTNPFMESKPKEIKRIRDKALRIYNHLVKEAMNKC